ncbi:alpha/beta hydrolase [Tsuneonella mangrovi]|uniref:alpha/beta hydrolase n=1 Tax=Tsuneonella mangrovi TaxID=1982042 RepID=UPI000BA2832C|nr:alpha/beta hydrolase [Tsuneonella mangrovi]
MRKSALFILAFAVAAPANAADRNLQAVERPARAMQTISFGSDPLQALDFWAGSGRSAPLVVFVHGGGWKRGDKSMMQGSAKLADWQAKGYAVASINYRLVPVSTVEDEAADVAAAVAWLRSQSARLGIDPQRIVLVGHSAGAHLVALVGTDPQWLRGAGMALGDLRGVIALDGAAYDVPRQMSDGNRMMQGTYRQAFGTDPGRQRALSPTMHAARPNAPGFLLLHVDRADGTSQTNELGAALRKADTPVEIDAINGKGLRGHMEINRKLGEPDYPATAIVDRWLAARFGG